VAQTSTYHYQFGELNKLFEEILSKSLPPQSFMWLKEMAAPQVPVSRFNTAFVSLPRKTGRQSISASPKIQSFRPGLNINNWTIDRLARVWLLMNRDPSNKEEYFKTVSNLFMAAEVHELIALYSSLPLLAYPEMWTPRCAEGIRNNIADVLTSIMCNNPYPSENLDEAAWNQMVLKAFFTEKPVDEIIGLDKRANQELASTLSDYAHERWAAHRPVNPQLWRCVGPFINETIYRDIEKISASGNPLEREAAALAARAGNYAPAKKLISPDLEKEIEKGELTWSLLAKKIKDYVLQ
jgi:hypothetical protein